MLPLISKENIPEPYYITILNFLYKSIIEALNAIDTDKSEKINSLGSVMIDDISVLLFYGCPSSLVMKFIFWLKRQIYQRNGCLIVLSHGDQPFEEDKECSSLTHSLLHSCEAWFRVSALPSGLSQDVHGQVTIHSGPQWPLNNKFDDIPVQFTTSLPTLHYQLRDNNITFFPKGTSQGVL
ncbi:Elongator subunit elp6, variant 3 [Entomophthora muscae]|nr:Elongator subunit elp6, variant 3 [Entomophthora muscae]